MYFNLENFKLLCKAIKNGEDVADDTEIVNDIMNHCVQYVNSVAAHEKTLELIRFRYESDELIRRIEEVDHLRRAVHNVAIGNCNIINRLANSYGVGEIFTGNTNNRYEVADFCGEVSEMMSTIKSIN